MVLSCCVLGCKNESYPGSRFSFHGFPKNENQKLKWENAVPGKRKISKWSVVCSEHFKCDDDFIPGYIRKILKPDAVPSIFPKCNARKAKNPGLTLHRMPRNKIMMNKWLEVIGVDNLNPTIKDWSICSLHFEESSINRTLDVSRLKEGSVPSASLLPWSNLPKKQTSSNIRVSEKTTLCEKENRTRSPSPMSDVSGDSSPEESPDEEAISVSACGASGTTFAEAWSPIRNSSDSAIGSSKNRDSSPTVNGPSAKTDSPALTTIGSSKNNVLSQQYRHLVTIHEQNYKIKILTERCKLNKKKIKCLREQIRRRDRRITQLTYVVKKLKENICFNNEGTIILEESEIAEGSDGGNDDINAQIRMCDDSSSSSSDSTSNQHSLSRPSAGDSSQDATCVTTPSPPPAPSSPIQLPLSVSTTSPSKTHGRGVFPKDTKSNDLALVIAPLANIKNKTKKSLNSRNSAIVKDSTVTVPRATNKKTLKPLDSTDVIKKTNSKPKFIRYTNKTKSKPDESTDNTETQTSKELTLTTRLNNRKIVKLYDTTDLSKEANSEKSKKYPIAKKTKSKSDQNIDNTETQTAKDLTPTTPRFNNTKIVKLYDTSDLSKEANSERSKKNPIVKKTKSKSDHNTDNTEVQTAKELTPTSPRLNNTKIVKLYDTTDKESNSEKTKKYPIVKKTKSKSDQNIDNTETQTSKELTTTTPRLNNTKIVKLFDSNDRSKEANSEKSKKYPIVKKTKSKTDQNIDNTEAQTAKELTTTAPRLNNRKIVELYDTTDKESNSEKTKKYLIVNKTKSKSDQYTANTEVQTAKELTPTTLRLNNTKIVKLFDRTDVSKEANSEKSKKHPIANKTKLKPDESSDNTQTPKRMKLTIPRLTNTKTLNTNDSTDLSEEAKSEKPKNYPITNKTKDEQTTNDLTPTIPSICNTLEEHVSTDLINEVTSESDKLSKTIGTNKNEFIYIIEVD